MAESTLPSLFSLWNRVQEKLFLGQSPSPQHVVPKLTKLNDMVYLVHQPLPDEKPELEIVFFHGLQLQHSIAPYATTWMTRDNSECWLQTWLVESFPRARIFTVSYDSSSRETLESGRMDMYQTGENLVSDLTGEEVSLGQAGCPVVLVGHCLGGLVLKEVCLAAESACRRKTGKPRELRAQALLSNLKGMFFYGTPHTGSLLGDMLQDCFKAVGALAEEIHTLKVSSTRRNESFMGLKSEKKWLTFGIGESRETFVECIGSSIHVVLEASTRPYMDEYYSAPGDHYAICKPEGKNDSPFLRLCEFLRTIQKDCLLQRAVILDISAQLPYYVDEKGRIQAVQKMLAQSDAFTLFIVGLSGCGKTALAQQVFYKIRHNYDVSCFVSLESIEATGSTREGILRKVQEELGEADRGPSQNLSRIVHYFKEKSFLFVLDNVESQDQLDALCVSSWMQKSSSRIIVTTTNPSSVATTTPWLRSPLTTFSVQALTYHESKALFCHYAFRDGDGPEDLKDHIKQVILRCDNYPLFLKILGACISKRNFKYKPLWEDLVTRLEEAEEVNAGHDEKLWAKLRLCYDGLEPSEKQIFLDIATIFYGYPLSLLRHIWRHCRRSCHLALQNMEGQFFLSENNSGSIKMHNHLRNLGKRIACPEGIRIDKWQRIPASSAANNVVNYHEGIVETLALQLHPLENEFVTLRRNTFQNYVHLEYLILEDVSIQGTSLELPRSLVYLRWKNGLFVACPVDFTYLENLAALEFLDCKSMRSLPPDVVKAQKLTWLELEGCELFTELPFGLSNCLEHLGLNGTGLSSLPRDIGKFTRLTSLQVRDTQLKRIPQRLCRVETLRTLNLGGTAVTTLPEAFGNLKNLRTLDLQKTQVSSLPESMGQLQDLFVLNLNNTPLNELPDSLCRLQSLFSLSALNTQLTTLPSNVGDMVMLTNLSVTSTKWRGFPQSFGKLFQREVTAMLVIPLDTCGMHLDSVEVRDREEDSALDPRDGQRQLGVPFLVSQLSAFRAVNVLYLVGKGYAQYFLPSLFNILQKLPLLEYLGLHGFDLPETIPSDLGKLTGLGNLTISKWDSLQEVPECLGKLCKLRFLILEELPRLGGIRESLTALPSSLNEIYVYKCGSLQLRSHSLGRRSSSAE